VTTDQQSDTQIEADFDTWQVSTLLDDRVVDPNIGVKDVQVKIKKNRKNVTKTKISLTYRCY